MCLWSLGQKSFRSPPPPTINDRTIKDGIGGGRKQTGIESHAIHDRGRPTSIFKDGPILPIGKLSCQCWTHGASDTTILKLVQRCRASTLPHSSDVRRNPPNYKAAFTSNTPHSGRARKTLGAKVESCPHQELGFDLAATKTRPTRQHRSGCREGWRNIHCLRI